MIKGEQLSLSLSLSPSSLALSLTLSLSPSCSRSLSLSRSLTLSLSLSLTFSFLTRWREMDRLRACSVVRTKIPTFTLSRTGQPTRDRRFVQSRRRHVGNDEELKNFGGKIEAATEPLPKSWFDPIGLNCLMG